LSCVKVKGIIILGFEKYSKTRIDTQFPSNICEFLGVTTETLKGLVERHLNKKMEPNYIELTLQDEVNVASFYSGFSFRHYVGNPNFAICIFLSQDDILSNEFEGMMRRIAHELLPKREALNFDDILGQYYEMLKKEELFDVVEEKKSKDTKPVISKEEADIKKKNSKLQELLDEKKSKIRELTRKYTELVSENTKKSEDIQSYKEEISEQYIKLEKWSQQMADLNQNNAKLMADIKILNQKIEERDDFLKEKERQIEALSTKLTGAEEVEDEAEKMLQEKVDLKNINLSLNSELEKLEKISAKEKEKETFREQIFDLKKEIKVLRRERDHYRKIVKEKNLLK